MKTTKEQVEEITLLNQLANRIRTDQAFMEHLLNETEKYQPVMFSGMIYFSENEDPATALDVVTLFLIVWSCYRKSVGLQHEITTEEYQDAQQKTFGLFNYLEGEEDMSVLDMISGHEFLRRQLPLLPVFLNHCLEEWPSLKKLNHENNTLVHLYLKVFIDCFENRIESS